MIPALRKILLDNPNLSSFVEGERIYTLRRWRDAQRPAIILSRVSNTPTNHKGAVSSIDMIRVQLSIFADDPATGDQIGAFARAALDRYSGTVTVATIDYHIDQILFEDESDDYDDNQKIYYKSQYYFV